MKNHFLLCFGLLSILILCSCEKEEPEYYRGYIYNRTSYTLTVKIEEVVSGVELKVYYELSPNYKSEEIELEEKKYLFEATKNDGSYYGTAVLDVNGLHGDAITPIDSITCDWWVQFK